VSSVVLLVSNGFLLAGIVFGLLVRRAWKSRRFMGCLTFLLLFLVAMLSGLLILLVSAGTMGYKALTREDLAATAYVFPLGNQQFRVKIARPGAADTEFALAGDELYMDARILKWKPIVNVLGLHTAFCLDRISGRYSDIRDEQTKVRTLYSMNGTTMPWDLFFLRVRYGFLSPVLDAQYGSAAFVPVGGVKVVRILVTGSGLIARSE
jgi:hypothetical protein